MKMTPCSSIEADKYKLNHLFSEDIIARSFIMDFTNKEYIQRQDSEVEYIYMIIRGKAKIVRLAESGKQIILQFIGDGAFVGELTLVGSETITKDVVAIGDVRCFAVPYALAERELMSDNAFVRTIAKFIGDKVLSREEHFTKLQAYEVKYRLAEVILATSIDNVYCEKQTEIAEYLGISYRHMLYTIKYFKDNDYLTKIPHGYLVDSLKLKQLLEEVK